MRQYPQWSTSQYAQATGRSVSWDKKWEKRLNQAPLDAMQVLLSHSRAHHAPYHRWDRQVIQRLGEMREHPPEHLQRVPGPKALVYSLQRDPDLQALGVPVPRSARTVWKLLRKLGYLLPHEPRQHQPLEPRDPLEEVQVDVKDAPTVPANPSGEGKRQQVIEGCNFVAAGTSILLAAQAHDAFREETAFEAVLTFLRTSGRPRMVTFDRDTRWVGRRSGGDFPSPLVRLLISLEIIPNICRPHRPDKNAYGERYHRTSKQECLLVHRPGTLEEVRTGTEQFLHHSHQERPRSVASLWQSSPACSLSRPASAFPTAYHRAAQSLAPTGPSASLYPFRRL
jgi:transposase InsO family protein